MKNRQKLIVCVFAVCLLDLDAVPCPVRTEAPSEEKEVEITKKPRVERQVIHTSDAASYFGKGTWLYSDPVKPEELRQWIRNVAAGGATTYVPEVYWDGYSVFYLSRHIAPDRGTPMQRFFPMMEAGTTPLEIFVDEAHKQNIELLAGFRMNDRHGANKAFFKNHPDWKLKDLGHGVDYSLPEVRDWMFSILEEVAGRFDVDGLELNFIRHGYCFPPATAAQQHPLMTDFMRRVRTMLDEHGRLKGRRLLLGARVPTTLEQCRHFGFDVPTWIADKLIDYVAPTDWHCTDFNVQYEEFAELTQDSDCFLYPAIQPDVVLGGTTLMTLDNYRAAVQNFYGAGADGFSTHNYDTYMWGQLRSKRYPGRASMYPKALHYFKILRNPRTVLEGDRHYLFHPVIPQELWPRGYRRCPLVHRRTVVKRSEPDQRSEYRFRIYEHLPKSVDLPTNASGLYEGQYNNMGKIPGATLIFRAMGLVPGDEIVVDINGKEIPLGRIQHIWYQDGRPGWKGRPLPPYTECQFQLTAPPAIYGDNYLGIRLLKSSAEVARDIVVDELEVTVHLKD